MCDAEVSSLLKKEAIKRVADMNVDFVSGIFCHS